MNKNMEKLPPAAVLMQMITGFWMSSAIYVAAKLALADHMSGGPVNSDELAQRVVADPDTLYRLLRALAGLGVFTETAPRFFALTPIGNLLRSNVPGSLRAFSLVGRELGWEPWGELLHSVCTGETAFDHLHGEGYFEYLKQNPEAARMFGQAMTAFVTTNGLAAATAYDFSTFSKIVDVGGGNGALMEALLRQNPKVKGIVFDHPDVVAAAEKRLVLSGLSGRCECIGGDFFEAVPSGGDAYLLASVIHDWDDERALAILRNCRRAMGSGAKIFLLEMVIPSGDMPFFGKLLDLNMLVNFGGRERTEAEYRDLLSAAGFKLKRIVPTRTPTSLMEAAPV